MPKFLIKTPLQLDKELFPIGKVVELTPETAKTLVAAGAVEPVPGADAELPDPAADSKPGKGKKG